jgi:hypothetical protein
MLKQILVSSILIAIAWSNARDNLSAAALANDYLGPVDRTFEQNELGAAYRRLYEKKLLRTPGDVARFIFLPVLNGEERVASVYHSLDKKSALPGGYWVTATQSSMSLWDCVKPGVTAAIDPRTIRVRRRDAPLPESTARALHEVWLAMLTATRSMPTNEIPNESDTMIFSATNADGTILRAQAYGFSDKNRALIELGDGLVQYCDVPASDRLEVARKIEKAAVALLKRISPDGGKNRK